MLDGLVRSSWGAVVGLVVGSLKEVIGLVGESNFGLLGWSMIGHRCWVGCRIIPFLFGWSLLGLVIGSVFLVFLAVGLVGVVVVGPVFGLVVAFVFGLVVGALVFGLVVARLSWGCCWVVVGFRGNAMVGRS